LFGYGVVDVVEVSGDESDEPDEEELFPFDSDEEELELVSP